MQVLAHAGALVGRGLTPSGGFDLILLLLDFLTSLATLREHFRGMRGLLTGLVLHGAGQTGVKARLRQGERERERERDIGKKKKREGEREICREE